MTGGGGGVRGGGRDVDEGQDAVRDAGRDAGGFRGFGGQTGGRDGGDADLEWPVRRRSPAAGGRPRTVRVTLSEAEYGPIHAAAQRDRVSDATWLGEVGVTASVEGTVPRDWGQAMRAIMMMRAELMEDRRVLRNVGGNANDIARAANILLRSGTDPDPEIGPDADGSGPGSGPAAELAVQAARVLAVVERVVERIDQSVERLDEQMPTARAARQRELRAAKRRPS